MNETPPNNSDEPYKLEQPLEFFWTDIMRLTSELKARRWDVLKWSVTVNIALTVLYISMKSPNSTGGKSFEYLEFQIEIVTLILVFLLTLIAGIFIYIQNHQIEKLRTTMIKVIQERLDKYSKDVFEQIYGKLPIRSEDPIAKTDKLGSRRDWIERPIYYLVIGVSAFPALGLTLMGVFSH